ncbi:DNA-directed RNA polymerases I [Polyplosphaeria fusca]|uniref:DNA-directed RNA polymerases I, II, and III subunit RPABC1 n=1 Tax=Polyplosphaeria fusca TaxID=682080 RepID=A0A9P4V8G1_9PLEO|nr:DNA-directed RNA polymerases I [Polyplosphaeria fusca]
MEDRENYNPNTVRLWRAYKTAKEMCMDRGYNILEDDTTLTLDQFKDKFCDENGEVQRNRLNFSAEPSEDMMRKHALPPTKHNPDPAPSCGRIWVEFNSEDNVGLKHLREYMGHLMQDNFYVGILITPKPVTGMGLRLLRSLSSTDAGPPGGIEVFVEQDLLVNITKHELVPKHVLLSREEKAQLLERYRLRETQLPRIQVTDPVAKYLGLKRGQVVKIIRKSETAGRYASYRWAI